MLYFCDPAKAVHFDGKPVRYADRLRQVRLSVEIAHSQGIIGPDEAGERIARLTEEIRLAELVDDKERNREAQEKAERAQMLAELKEALKTWKNNCGLSAFGTRPPRRGMICVSF